VAKVTIVVTLDERILTEVGRLVARRIIYNRNSFIEEAVKDKLQQTRRNHLAHECLLLDPFFEVAMSEEGIDNELSEWPEF